MKDMGEIYKTHLREEVEPVTVEIRRFTVDGEPACMAWYGLGSHERMACQFVGSAHFGSKAICMITGEQVRDNRPIVGCIVWGIK